MAGSAAAVAELAVFETVTSKRVGQAALEEIAQESFRPRVRRALRRFGTLEREALAGGAGLPRRSRAKLGEEIIEPVAGGW